MKSRNIFFYDRIFSTMEENNKSLLYFGIRENECAKRWPWDKYTVQVYRSGRKGKIRKGRLQYFYVPIPEYYSGKISQPEHSLPQLRENEDSPARDMENLHESRKGCKDWKADKLLGFLKEALEYARPDYYYLHPLIRNLLGAADSDNAELPPLPLLEAMLHERSRFQKVSICLPHTRRTDVAEILIYLLDPYLSRINSMTICGGEETLYEELEDYFYEEYGIVAARDKIPEQGSFILDLWSGERETLKFLDTMVKNGYNTKVN